MGTITERDLKAVCDRINAAAGTPMQPWSKIDGKSRANIGNYHLDYAYGEVALERMMNEGGGVEQIIGRCKKRELYGRMHAFLSGIAVGKTPAPVPAMDGPKFRHPPADNPTPNHPNAA